jgi:carboxyl-terminal processing protease
VGSRSLVKVWLQKPIDLTYSTQLKVTISRYYTPSGRCIQTLDYTNKDKMVVPHELKKKIIMPTDKRKGRTVYDGGLLPDVQLAETKRGVIANALEKMTIFDYVTNYYYKNHP